MNASNEVTLHQSEILPRSEMSDWFVFISGLMQTCSNTTTLHSQLNNSFLLGCGFYRGGQRGRRQGRNESTFIYLYKISFNVFRKKT